MADLDAARLHEAGLAVDLHGDGCARRHRHGLASGDAEAAAPGVQDGQVEVVDGDQLQETVVHLKQCNHCKLFLLAQRRYYEVHVPISHMLHIPPACPWS